MKAAPWIAAAVIVFSALGTAIAESGILSYRLEFSRTGRSVNYPKPTDGYLVVDLNSGGVSSIIVLEDPDTKERYFTTRLLTGRYFQVSSVSSSAESDVIFASSGGFTVDSSALQVSGRVSSRVGVGLLDDIPAAKRMTGVLLLSAADSVSFVTTGETEQTEDVIGYIGTANVIARLAQSDSHNFNANGKSASDAISEYSTWFTNEGISSDTGTDPIPIPDPIVDDDLEGIDWSDLGLAETW